MADWNTPSLGTPLVDAVDDYKERDLDSAYMFDVGSPTNIPENAIRFNVGSGIFQRRESGVWTTKLLTSASLDTVLGTPGTFGSSTKTVTITANAQGRITTLSESNIPSATVSQQGIVQLINSFTDTSLDKAPTAKSVKNVNDRVTPLTTSGNTTNFVGATGHTHDLDMASEADGEAGVSGFKVSSPLSTQAQIENYLPYSTTVVNLSNFSPSAPLQAGFEEIRFTKIGNLVNITGLDNIVPTGSESSISVTGAIPAEYRPTTSAGIRQSYYSSNTGTDTLEVDDNGDILFIHRDYSGNLLATSFFSVPNMTYSL